MVTFKSTFKKAAITLHATTTIGCSTAPTYTDNLPLEAPTHNYTQQNNVYYSNEHAKESLEIARLPEIYERALYKEDMTKEKAQKKVLRAAPQAADNNLKIMQFEDTTAIVYYNADNHSTTVTFDPTMTFGDKINNIQSSKKAHSLGGQVHKGLYKDLIKKHDGDGFSNKSLIDLIQKKIQDNANRDNICTTMTVHFSGFSKGGAQTTIAAAELMARDVFSSNPDVTLGNIYTFGSPGYGDNDFITNLHQKAQDLNAHIWRVEQQDDVVPTVLTANGAHFYTRDSYEQAGDIVFMLPTDDGEKTQIIFNISDADLKTLRQRPVQNEHAHSSLQYQLSLNKASTHLNKELTKNNDAPLKSTQKNAPSLPLN